MLPFGFFPLSFGAVVVVDTVVVVVARLVVVDAVEVEDVVVETVLGTTVVDGGGGAAIVVVGRAGVDVTGRATTAAAGSLRTDVELVSAGTATTVVGATVDVGSGNRSSRSASTCGAGDSAASEFDTAAGGGSV